MKFNVTIHYPGSEPVTHLFHEPKESYRCIHISYHLGEHYNSIRRGDDPIMTKQVPIKDYPIWYDTAKC